MKEENVFFKVYLTVEVTFTLKNASFLHKRKKRFLKNHFPVSYQSQISYLNYFFPLCAKETTHFTKVTVVKKSNIGILK